MAQDKVLLRIEQKLDALLEAHKLDAADYGGEAGGKVATPKSRKLTPAEQQAIDNAPKYVEAKYTGNLVPAEQPATPAAPDVKSAPVPPDAVGQATVVTEQPTGTTKVETKPASEVKKQAAKGAP